MDFERLTLSEAYATFCRIIDSAARIALCDPVIVTFLQIMDKSRMQPCFFKKKKFLML